MVGNWKIDGVFREGVTTLTLTKPAERIELQIAQVTGSVEGRYVVDRASLIRVK